MDDLWTAISKSAIIFLSMIGFASAAEPEQRERVYYAIDDPSLSSPGSDSPPSWSADGKEIFFQFTRDEGIAQIWSVKPNGNKLRHITNGAYAAGSPNACSVDDRLAFIAVADEVKQLFVMNLENGQTEQLTSGGRSKYWPVFSPDCSEMLFLQERDLENDRHDLRVLDIATGVLRGGVEEFRYIGWSSWSADGQSILFYGEIAGFPNHMHSVPRAGGEITALTSGDHGDYWNPHMSVDGRLLSYSYTPRERLQWKSGADIWQLDVEKQQCERITDNPWIEHGQRLSPDGKQIVYWDRRSGYNEIYVRSIGDGKTRQLTFQHKDELLERVKNDGVEAALGYARRMPKNKELFSASAMAEYLLNRANAGDEPVIALAEFFVEHHADSMAAKEMLAREYFRAGKLAKAHHAIQSLIEDGQFDEGMTSRLGVMEIFTQASGKTLAALEQTKLHEGTVNAVGYTLLRQGDVETALDVLSWNIQYYPDSANAYDSYGEALYWNGAYAAAKVAYENALRLNPENNNARNYLERIKNRAAMPKAQVPCPVLPAAK